MKEQIKIVHLDGHGPEVHIVTELNFGTTLPDTTRNDSIQEVLQRASGDMYLALQNRQKHCEKMLINAVQNKQVCAETENAFYYKDNGKIKVFNKEAYAKMLEGIKILSARTIDVQKVLSDSFLCDQLIKAIVFDEHKYVYDYHKQEVIAALLAGVAGVGGLVAI